MQSEFTLVAGEIALRARAQIKERSLPGIEAVIDRVDVLGEQALEPRGRQFRQSRQTIFCVGDVAPDVRAEAIGLHIREQRALDDSLGQNAIGRRAEDFPMRHVRLRTDVHELAAPHQLLREMPAVSSKLKMLCVVSCSSA